VVDGRKLGYKLASLPRFEYPPQGKAVCGEFAMRRGACKLLLFQRILQPYFCLT
jgi:hypothetical protein